MTLYGFGALLLVFSLALSFFLSGMEAGVFALSHVRIRYWMRTGNRRAERLHRYLEQPESFFWTIVVGNSLANFVSAGLVVLYLHAQLGQRPVLAGVVFLVWVFLFYALADLLPKMLFRRYPNRLCLSLVGLFRFVHVLLQPLVAPLTWISRWGLRWTQGPAREVRLFSSREELRFAVQDSGPNLTSEERVMISRVLELHSLEIGQFLIPMSKAVTVNAKAPMGQVLRLCRESGHTRLPVWVEDDGRRRIGGLVSLKTLLYQSDLDPERPAEHYLKPALYLSAASSVESALRRMQRGGQRLAIVLGLDRRELGVVSLEDLLRHIFGEVRL